MRTPTTPEHRGRTEMTPEHRSRMEMTPEHRGPMEMTQAIRVMLSHLKKVTTPVKVGSRRLSLQERRVDAGVRLLHAADKGWCGWVSCCSVGAAGAESSVSQFPVQDQAVDRTGEILA